jgi:hypothetical protein
MARTGRELLAEQGYFITKLGLPEAIRELVRARDWTALDAAIRPLTLGGGAIFEALRPHAVFRSIEFIISLRSSLEHPDEDGIWHDDGSRVLAFSLSLTLEHEAIAGGRLELRKRGSDTEPTAALPTPEYGTMMVFATGHQGYEHRIRRVERGERLIIAGWCS